MRRIVVCVVGVLVVAGPSAGKAVASHKTRIAPCRRGHSGTVAADALAHVYERSGVLFGCMYGHSHTYSLGSDYFHLGRDAAVLSGATVAVQEPNYRPNPLIVVSNLRTGRVLRKVHTGGPPHRGCTACDGLASAIAVKEDGSLAWLVEDGHAEHIELRVSDRNGSRTLAVGEDGEAPIDEKSLAVHGSTVYWTQSGKVMSAPLD